MVLREIIFNFKINVNNRNILGEKYNNYLGGEEVPCQREFKFHGHDIPPLKLYALNTIKINNYRNDFKIYYYH